MIDFDVVVLALDDEEAEMRLKIKGGRAEIDALLSAIEDLLREQRKPGTRIPVQNGDRNGLH